MTQHGFFIDQSRCIGCNACAVACKQWHDIPPGPIKWLRVYQWEKGDFPNIDLKVLPIMCFHCEDPLCVKACPHGAIFKEEKYGAVLVDSDKCKGERRCWKACPYGAPQYDGDALGIIMSKCNMCLDRLVQGNKPICVLSCSMRALEFGPIDELKEKYGDLRRLDDLPNDSITKHAQPAVVFKPAASKKQIVPWDSKKALELWGRRHSDNNRTLPNISAQTSDKLSQNIIGRSKLVLKAKNCEELMYYTTDDE